MPLPSPSWSTVKRKLALWLLEGISPRRLALTLALGFVLGCLPLVGVTTGLCVIVAIGFRLNLAAIQAANYAAMPFQLALIVPFARFGGKLTPSLSTHGLEAMLLAHPPLDLIRHFSAQIGSQLAVLAGQALLAWLVVSIPVVLLLTATLTGVLRRVPAFAAAEPRN